MLRTGKQPKINRERALLGDNVYRQYFSTDPIYDHSALCRRYRVSCTVFHRLYDVVVTMDSYFVHELDCT